MKNKKINTAFLFLIFSIAIALLLFMRSESDYFWHIKAGEYMVKNGLLRKDVFSWIVQGKYWFSHEWLFEVIIYYFKLLFGKIHILIYGFVCLFSLLLIIFHANKENFLKNIPFSLLWLSFSLILFVYTQARPHLLSFNFLAITIYLLFSLYKNENTKKIYFLPLLSILWVNVHGGSSNLSYLFCLIFIIGGLFNFNLGKIESKRLTKKQFLKYLIVMLLCIVSICINLHGIKMLSYPYINISNSLMINNINEWQPTTIGNTTHLPYFILCFIVVLSFLISNKKISFLDLLLFLVVLFLGLKSIRFWAYTYIVMSFVVFNYIKKRKEDKYTYPAIIIVGILFLSLFAFNYKASLKGISNKSLNKEIVTLIKKEKPKRLFNLYDYGGELIYNDIKVFIDGRADLYSNYNFEDYLNISKLQNDYIKLINKYDFDYFLVNKSYSIYTYLKYNDNYQEIYNKDGLYLYKKIA